MDNRLMNERRPRLFWILDSKKVPNSGIRVTLH